MSHHSSPPPKHKGEHKGHGLPRGSERWAGLGVEVFEAWVTIELIWVGIGDVVFICVTPVPTSGAAPPGTRTEVLQLVQCPCLLEGRQAGLTVLLHRRRPPIA